MGRFFSTIKEINIKVHRLAEHGIHTHAGGGDDIGAGAKPATGAPPPGKTAHYY